MAGGGIGATSMGLSVSRLGVARVADDRVRRADAWKQVGISSLAEARHWIAAQRQKRKASGQAVPSVFELNRSLSIGVPMKQGLTSARVTMTD